MPRVKKPSKDEVIAELTVRLRSAENEAMALRDRYVRGEPVALTLELQRHWSFTHEKRPKERFEYMAPWRACGGWVFWYTEEGTAWVLHHVMSHMDFEKEVAAQHDPYLEEVLAKMTRLLLADGRKKGLLTPEEARS
jgi:hypothetical protein